MVATRRLSVTRLMHITHLTSLTRRSNMRRLIHIALLGALTGTVLAGWSSLGTVQAASVVADNASSTNTASADIPLLPWRFPARGSRPANLTDPHNAHNPDDPGQLYLPGISNKKLNSSYRYYGDYNKAAVDQAGIFVVQVNWSDTEPSQNQFDWSVPDAQIRYAESQHKAVALLLRFQDGTDLAGFSTNCNWHKLPSQANILPTW